MKHFYSAISGAIIVCLIFWAGMKYQKYSDAETRAKQLVADSVSERKVETNAKERQTRIDHAITIIKHESSDWSVVLLPDAVLNLLHNADLSTESGPVK